MPTLTLKRPKFMQLAAFCKLHEVDHWFVAKDRGAYVGVSNVEDRVLFYFAGCNPETDQDYYQICRDRFGGNDFGERIPASVWHDLVADSTITQMQIEVTRAGKLSIRAG